MWKRILSIFIFLLLSTSIFSEEMNSGIIYGPNWAYMISAPKGYVWDNESLSKNGIMGLFYKEGQDRFYGNKHHLYINPVRKDQGYPSTLDELVKWDTEYFQKNDPALKITYYQDIELSDKKIVKIYKFDQDERKYYMLHGYVTENNASFVFIMVARTREERTDFEKFYKELIKSFTYMDKT